MATLNWQTLPAFATTNSHALANPWFGISMGLIGLIIGFALNRFIVPITLGAQATPSSPSAVQGLVIQPSATPPLPGPLGGGCGCGGGACGSPPPTS